MNEEFFSEIDKVFQNEVFADSLRRAIHNPHPGIKIAKPDKLKELLESKNALEELIKENWEEAEVRVKLAPNFSSAFLTVEVDSIEIGNYDLLLRIIGKARNIEFTPLKSGKLNIGLSFGNFFETIDTEENENVG